MSRYSGKIHKSILLNFDRENSWLSPEQIQEKENLNGILNRIMFSIKLLNFILNERDKHVNDYREKMNSQSKLGDTWEHLILLTESYFSYVTTILNAYSELIYEMGDDFPEIVKGDFSKLWEHVRQNGASEEDLDEFFKNKMLWYELYVRLPRNNLVIHDKQTSGYAMNDHGIDVYIGKHGSHDKEKTKEAMKLVSKIKSNHTEFDNLNLEDYFNPVYRQVVEHIDILSKYEIQLLVNACGIAGFDFPYIPHVTPRLQEFINFVDEWLKNKFQMCPTCKQPNLRILRMVIDPNIRKFDPNNIWFGWKCDTCDYRREFNLNTI